MTGQDTGCGLEWGARTLSDVREAPRGRRRPGAGPSHVVPDRVGQEHHAALALPQLLGGLHRHRHGTAGTATCRERESAPPASARGCAQHAWRHRKAAWGRSRPRGAVGTPTSHCPSPFLGCHSVSCPSGFHGGPPTWTRTPCSQRGSSHLWAEPPGRCLRTDQAQGQPRWAGGGPGPSACH